MEPIITVNQYPIGWEWLDRVPLEDFTWLIEIFSTMTDNTDTYDFVGYTDSETLPGHQKICSVDKHSPPPNKQNKVYHLTNPNTNPIHPITNPGILHI
jgi:hypothetical protein